MYRLTLAALLLLSAAAPAQEGSDAALQAAVEHPARPDAERARDRDRNPLETLTFFGIRPDMTVVELYPGGGWYSGVLAPYLASDGQLVAAHFNLERQDAPSYYQRLYDEFGERFADRDEYGEIRLVAFDPPDLLALGEPGSADMALTFRNIHTWLGDGQLDNVFSAVYDVLKPGGIFGVVGHRLPEDRTQDPQAGTGYVKESVVIETAEKAGFTLAGKSDVNANADDDADHPNGVWTLPPNLDVPDGENADDYRRIGESDRFTLKFVK